VQTTNSFTPSPSVSTKYAAGKVEIIAGAFGGKLVICAVIQADVFVPPLMTAESELKEMLLTIKSLTPSAFASNIVSVAPGCRNETTSDLN
jgi:hypothetical protein